MNTEQLREFIEFSKTLNYAQAAKALFISKPTLHSHMRALEKEAGFALTLHRGTQTALTPAGKSFLKRARDLVLSIDEAVEQCREIACNSASLVVSFLDYPWIENLFLQARDNLLSHYPETHLDLAFSPKMNANIEAILTEQVDITVLPLTRSFIERGTRNAPDLPEDVSSVYLGAREYRFWITRGHRLFEKATISVADLDGSSLLLGNTSNMQHAGRKIADYFSEQGASLELDFQPFPTSTDYYLSDASRAFGVILPGHRFEKQATSDFRVFAIDGIEACADLYLVYRDAALNECGRKFIGEIQALLERKQETCH